MIYIKERLLEDDYTDKDFEGDSEIVSLADTSEYQFEIFGVSDMGEEILDYAVTKEEAETLVDSLQDSFGDSWDVEYRDINKLAIDELDNDPEDDWMTDYDEDDYLDPLEDFDPDDEEYEESLFDDEQINEYGTFTNEDDELVEIIKQLGNDKILDGMITLKDENISNNIKLKKARALFSLHTTQEKIDKFIGDTDDFEDFIQTFLVE